MAMVLRLILLVCCLHVSGCSKLFFYPMKPWAQNPAMQGLDYDDVVLIHPNGLRIHGWWLPAKKAPRDSVKGTVFFLHGNAQNMSTHLASVQWLPSQGYNVFLLDYRGYGLSEGKPVLPEVFADVQLGLDWLRSAGRIEGPLTVFGQSLGASLAVTVLAEPSNQGVAECVVLEAGFASYKGITNDVMKQSWLLWPLRWMIVPGMPARDWDPERRIASLSPARVLVMHSEDDRVIPYAHGLALSQAAAEPKTFQRLRGGHIQALQDPAVRQRMLQFLQRSNCSTASHKQGQLQSRKDAVDSTAPSDENGEPTLAPLPTTSTTNGERLYSF